jgi:hypothetical protein
MARLHIYNITILYLCNIWAPQTYAVGNSQYTDTRLNDLDLMHYTDPIGDISRALLSPTEISSY